MSRLRTPSTASCSAGSKSISERADGQTAPPAAKRGRLPPVALRREAQAQRLQANEALGVALVVDLVLLEGDVRQAVEAVRRLPTDDPRQPLVELQPDPALDLLLAFV